LKGSSLAPAPARNPLAYIFAMFMPGGQAPVAALIFVVIIGMVAAMAIPAFQKVRQATRETSIKHVCASNLRRLGSANEQYTLENGKAAASLDDLVGSGKYVSSMPECPSGGEYQLVAGDTQDSKHVICTIHGSLEDLQKEMSGGASQ